MLPVRRHDLKFRCDAIACPGNCQGQPLNKIYDAYLYSADYTSSVQQSAPHISTFKSRLKTMKFFVSLLSILGPAVVGVMGASVRDIPVLSDYDKLFQLCEGGGENSVSSSHTILPLTYLYISQYVGVRYQNNKYVTYNFGDCYPYRLLNGNLAEMAVFCKAATCYNNP